MTSSTTQTGTSTAIPRVDLVLRGGRIWTGCEDLDGHPTEVSSIAVRDGKVVALGSDDDLAELAGDAARVLDLQGRRVVPGLIDSHIHAVRAGVGWNLSLHWEGIRSLSEGLAQVRERAAGTPAGTWIPVVGGWHARQLTEGRVPTRAELDEAAPDHPVYIQELYDRAVLNSVALRECGWDDSSPDPARGRLGRDSAGALTGEVFGVGAFAVPLAKALAGSADDAVAGTRAMLQEFAGHGLTGVDDGFGMLMTPQDYRPMYELWRAGQLPLRVRLFVSAWTRGGEVEDIASLTHIAQPGFGDGMLKVTGVGEIAHMGCHDMEGFDPFTISDQAYDELVEIVRYCAKAGWPMSIHAVLDSTLSRILDAWEQVEAETGRVRGQRFSIVHADEASPESLDRIARLEAGVMVQNRLMLKAEDYVELWDEDVVRGTPPLGEMRARGIPVGAGTDATRANWYSPWASVWWLVTGRSLGDAPARAAEHRMTVQEALAAFTRASAWFTDEEDHRGRLAVGFDADLCVPTLDPFDCDPDELREIRSDLTLLGGRVTHASGSFAGEGAA